MHLTEVDVLGLVHKHNASYVKWFIIYDTCTVKDSLNNVQSLHNDNMSFVSLFSIVESSTTVHRGASVYI